jgi:hypothetical protein
MKKEIMLQRIKDAFDNNLELIDEYDGVMNCVKPKYAYSEKTKYDVLKIFD